MAKKKKPTPSKKKANPKKKSSSLQEDILKDFEKLAGLPPEPKINKNAVYQRIYRLQNKIDKAEALPEKRKLEKELKKQKSLIGYKGLTPREESRYKKEKKSLTTRISSLQKKIKDGRVSETKRNRAARELMKLSGRLKELNRNLGIRVAKLPDRNEDIIEKDGVLISEEPSWVVRPDYLIPATNKGHITKYTFIWGYDPISESYSNNVFVDYKKRPDMVFSVWRQMFSYALLIGSPFVAVITQDSKRRSMEIREKEHKK